MIKNIIEETKIDKRGFKRPATYIGAQDLYKAGLNFFKKCDEKKKPYTVTGLALALGFSGRTELLRYQGKATFEDAVKKLKSIVEESVEERLFTHNPTGAIFWLKNFGWTDRQDIDIKQDIVVEIVHHLPKKPVDITPAK